jgi:multidrug efflux pump subunit AcrA (membrane-fusion protein)
MKSPSNNRRSKTKTVWIFLVLIGLVTAGVFGYVYWNQKTAVQAQAAAQSMTTRPVRKGSITLAASGSVTLVASKESSLAFSVSGTVAELNGTVGAQVKKGQVLAQLGNLDTLQAEIKNAEQDLFSAQQELAAFKSKALANQANAQLKVIDAQKAVEDTQGSVVQKDTLRCDQTTKDQAYTRYQRAVAALNALGDGGGNADYYLNTLLPQKKIVDQAKGAYDACAGFTDNQVASTQANLIVAQAELKQAQANLDTFIKNNGLDPTALATAENKVSSAQQALDTANENLTGATLTAPFDGTILSIAGKAGDTIEITSKNTTVPFITLADLAHPLLKYSIDETDMSMVEKGEAATVIFDAFANRSFKGTVTRVDPALSSTDGVPAVTGLIQLDLSQETDLPIFPKNLSGSVLIIQAAAENVLLVPVEALHEQNDGTYSVYVAGTDGRPTLKTVEIGLRDVASVEIKSGLNASDTVITSPVDSGNLSGEQ